MPGEGVHWEQWGVGSVAYMRGVFRDVGSVPYMRGIVRDEAASQGWGCVSAAHSFELSAANSRGLIL